MTDEERDMANAALLLDEKITERIVFALGSLEANKAITQSWQMRSLIQQICQEEIHKAIGQLSDRIKPQDYYSAPSYSTKPLW